MYRETDPAVTAALGHLLRNQRLGSVGVDPHHAAARVGAPERAVPLCEHAFWSLQVVTDRA